MSAVAEIETKTPTPEQQAALDSFTMPRPMRGQAVLWWPHGTRQDGLEEIGHVTRLGGRNVRIRLGDGRIMSAVKHVSDPKLKVNESQREDGCWDFTEAEKHWRDEAAKLAATVAELTRRVAALESKKKGD